MQSRWQKLNSAGLQTEKKILLSLISFFTPFFGFVIILNSKLEYVFFNHWIHFAFMVVLSLICFYASFFTFKIYKKCQDVRIFSIVLAFITFGFIFFLHSFSPHGWIGVPDDLFDITEHYGLFLGSTLLLGVVFPIKKRQDLLYNNRKKIIFGLLSFIFLFFIFLVFNQNIAILLESVVNIFIAITGFLFFIILFFVIDKYGTSDNIFIYYLVAGISVLVNTAIIPFFYQEGNALWWYFHVIFTLSFLIMFFGLLVNNVDSVECVRIFVTVPRNIILKKLIFFILAVSVIPLFLFSYSVFSFTKKGLEKQSIEDLVLVAESKEGHLISFLESIKNRAVDFSADYFIENTTAMIKNEPDNLLLRNSLSEYLRNDKIVLDDKIYGINIIDSNGIIIASTNDVEIGKDESDDDYYTEAIKARRGDAIIGKPKISHHFAVDERSMIVSAPIINYTTKENIGIIVNYIKTFELDNVLSGAQQLRLGALSGIEGKKDSLDVYLVNKDGLMISESKFLGEKVFLSQKVATEPANKCILNRKETSGKWVNYLNMPVYGASMCLINYDNWTLIVEVNENEILAPVVSLKQILNFLTVFLLILILSFSYYFAKKFVSPIQELSSVASKITNGDLTARANIQTRDEIRDLANQFNLMTESLVSSNKQTEAIIKSIPEPFFVLNKEGNIVNANDATLEMLKYTKEELIGKSIKDILQKDGQKNKKFKKEDSEKKVIRYVPEK